MSVVDEKYQQCEICGGEAWSPEYIGSIRDGKPGSVREGAEIKSCQDCGVLRLSEKDCVDAAVYRTGEYREYVGQDKELATYYTLHDPLQFFALRALRLETMRGMTVADIGAAGGSFLDTVSGFIKQGVAIEPGELYHHALREKGYEVFPLAGSAAKARPESVDVGVSFQVIEHVANPRSFLEEVKPLLKPGGRLIISTPNRNDILMKTAVDVYPSFFYRTAHRWYFDEQSLKRCAEVSGYEVEEIRYIHRYPLSNYLLWLRDKEPRGAERLAGIDELADGFWSSYLEQNGLSDTLFMECRC